MKKNSKHIVIGSREKNAFPYLDQTLTDRLKQSNSISLENNYVVSEKDGYWKVLPKNIKKK
ncbi:hypothetical protein D3C86_1619800 [compost metagenome]